MKFVKWLNFFLICDDDEQVNVLEAIFYYGTMSILIIIALVFMVLNITS